MKLFVVVSFFLPVIDYVHVHPSPFKNINFHKKADVYLFSGIASVKIDLIRIDFVVYSNDNIFSID